MKQKPVVAGSLLNSKQAAEFLGVSIYYVLEHTRGKREPILRSFKIGRNSRRFRLSDLEAWVDGLAKQAAKS